jgi:hypothetical protein
VDILTFSARSLSLSTHLHMNEYRYLHARTCIFRTLSHYLYSSTYSHTISSFATPYISSLQVDVMLTGSLSSNQWHSPSIITYMQMRRSWPLGQHQHQHQHLQHHLSLRNMPRKNPLSSGRLPSPQTSISPLLAPSTCCPLRGSRRWVSPVEIS